MGKFQPDQASPGRVRLIENRPVRYKGHVGAPEALEDRADVVVEAVADDAELDPALTAENDEAGKTGVGLAVGQERAGRSKVEGADGRGLAAEQACADSSPAR